jgi:hypothetical protein
MQIASKKRRIPATLRLRAGYAESSSPESATVIDPNSQAMEEEVRFIYSKSLYIERSQFLSSIDVTGVQATNGTVDSCD